MNSSLLILFTLSLGLVTCAPAEDNVSDIEKQQKAVEECNALFPIPNNPNADPREILIKHVISGETGDIRNRTWCTLNCVLKKVGFFDENSNMRPPAIFKYNLKKLPELAPYADIFLLRLFQNFRSSNGYNVDVCERAYIAYYRHIETIFILKAASQMQNDLSLKENLVKAVEEGKPLPEEVQNGILNYLKTTQNKVQEGSGLNVIHDQSPSLAAAAAAAAPA